jgi:RHS repeat-associated protein
MPLPIEQNSPSDQGSTQHSEPSSASQKAPGPSQSESSKTEIPSISLPKGGGAIRGIGEKFAANPVTGTGSMSVPIATSPGRSGFGPQLSLSYDSGTGNGPFGFGWNLSLPSITRKTDKGLPQYFDTQNSDVGSDVFILSGAEDLVPEFKKDASGNWILHEGKHVIFDEQRTVNSVAYTVRRYRPRIEGLFARIERWTRNSDGDTHWHSISQDNILTIYGKSSNSRIADPENPSHIFSWLICETRDDKGNAVLYEYKPEDGVGADLSLGHERNRGDRSDPRRTANRYLKRIRYGNVGTLINNGLRPTFLDDDLINNAQWMFETIFDYGEHDANAPKPDDTGQWTFRDDPFSSYRAGFEVRTTRLCQRVLMFHHIPDLPNEKEGYDGLVRSTDFIYSHEQEPNNARNPIYTFLRAVTQNSYKRKGNSYLQRSLPPVEFEYTQPVVQDSVEEVDAESLGNLPIGVDGANYQWTDLHGEGTPGILTEQAGAWFYKRNVSPIGERPIGERPVEFAPLERVAVKPNMALAGGAQFMDLAGNGRPDLVVMDGPMPGFYEHDGEEGWQSFQSFNSRLNRDTRDPNLRLVDLNGDGHADILITEDDAIVWHPSLAEEGFGPARRVHKVLDEEKGPHLVFADGTQSIYLADLSGDSLTDLVRIRNGEVCYWPNLGYGRFGTKISMDNAPHFDRPDQFEHSRTRLADIDGSGTTDIIYLHGDGVRLYFNQSGNSWSEAQVLNVHPKVDEIVSIAPADLLGNGTACLVWSSPLPGDGQQQMRYVNLMGKQKPHLLIKTTNNLGAETHVQYAPSTKFYLQDKRDGKPWITKLPFPVHVVEKVMVKDKWRNTRFATTYSYHHGYFDGIEREFRGFGRVEQIDVETYGEFASGNVSSRYITDDQTLYQPPVKTVTWFHTGAALDRKHILSHYQQEYFKVPGGFIENEFPEPELNTQQLETDEWREAMRACKGIPLRQEVYELDVDALDKGEQKPVKLFSTAYHNCNIQMLQAQVDNRHAVFLVTESEAITYQYDLDLLENAATPDPRIAHTLNLNIDEYGNVLQAVAIVYPRLGRHQDATLPLGAEDLIEQVQTETHLAYTETRFTNDVDSLNDLENYRLRLPCEVFTYELTGIKPDNAHFRLDELQKLWLSQFYQMEGIEPVDLAYHEIPDRNEPEKRIIEHVRMLFFNQDQDLTNPLELGTLNSLGLPFETYTLALTEDLLTAVFGNKLTDDVRFDLDNADKSGYQKDNDGLYWIRSGIAGFSAEAAEHFFLPERYTDPFGKTTTLDYDARDLFIKSSTDPVGNSVTVTQFDCRVLAPREIKDINDNLSEVTFDTLGLPMAVAVKGKGNDADNLLGFENEQLMPDRGERIKFFTQPFSEAEARRMLGNATARHLYYFGEIEETLVDGTKVIHWGEHPPSACAILRERHVVTPVVEDDGTVKPSPLQVAFEYSDGGGNVLVSKTQAEPEALGGSLRWIANGKTILNNKGNPVKQYEPSFTDSHNFEELDEVGVTPVMYYDAADRLIRTELPDGTFSRVEFSPWHVSRFDANDTLLEPGNEWHKRRTDPVHPKFPEFNSPENQRAAQLAAQHANTPAQVFLDSLGRDVISVEDNKDEKYLTFTKLDAEGKPLWIRDARGNLVMQYITPPVPNNQATDPVSGFVPCYDIAGNLLCQHSMDGGDRWMITDAAGQPFYAWDKNERVTDSGVSVPEDRVYHTTYDALRRPLEQQLRINNDPLQVIERIVYGDSPDLFPERPPGEISEAKERNLRGQVFQHYDSSGLMTNQNFDFKGNLLEVERQLAKAFDVPVIHWPEDSASREDMLDEIYTQKTQYDALDRMVRHENWHIEEREPAVYTPKYNERGLLVSEKLILREKETTAIKNIEHDAKGQRMRIEYGNGTTTRYTYNEETFRLMQLRTTKTSPGNSLPRTPSNRTDDNVYQNLYYTYDPVGNITEILDDAYEPVFFKNQLVEPRNLYTYDSLYRLIKATGRENFDGLNIPKAGKLPEVPIKTFPINNEQALRNYTQSYIYDSVGNIEQMHHSAVNGTWTRHYEYAEDSNRLERTWLGTDETNDINYLYDNHGSMLNLNNVADEYKLRWDSNDMIHHINLGGGGNAFYNYDSDKERTRKRIESNGNTIKERLYLGGMERYRRWEGNNPDPVEEIETHHLFDGNQRLLIAEDVISTDSDFGVGTLHKYQYSNHLGSVGLEVDEGGNIISYEEYHPYGTTAYHAKNSEIDSTKKRYRYTGMERDEESGLSYHSARYYLPWLGRWGSVDPMGLQDSINIFEYVSGNPVNFTDPSGNERTRVMPIISPQVEGVNLPTAPEDGGIGGNPKVKLTTFDGTGTTSLNNITNNLNYIDNFVYFEAQPNWENLTIDNIKLRYSDGTSIEFPFDLIDPGGKTKSDSFIHVGEVGTSIIKPVSNSRYNSLNAENTPRLAELATEINSELKIRAQTNVEIASLVYSFSGAIAALGGQSQVRIPPMRVNLRITPEMKVDLQRGVNSSNHNFKSQATGTVKPNRSRLAFWKGKASTPLEHNVGKDGTKNSPFTSWTTDSRVAKNFALRPTTEPPGVVINAKIGFRKITLSPNLKKVGLLPELGGGQVPESEFLVTGVVFGQASSPR